MMKSRTKRSLTVIAVIALCALSSVYLVTLAMS
jgi:hypothetical protein